MEGRRDEAVPRVGAALVPALYSPVVGGIVRTWTENAEQLWRVDDPRRFAAFTSRGLVTRAAARPGVMREAGLLDAEAGAALPSAVAYHERVVTPTGKVYLACTSGAQVSSRAKMREVGLRLPGRHGTRWSLRWASSSWE